MKKSIMVFNFTESVTLMFVIGIEVDYTWNELEQKVISPTNEKAELFFMII